MRWGRRKFGSEWAWRSFGRNWDMHIWTVRGGTARRNLLYISSVLEFYTESSKRIIQDLQARTGNNLSAMQVYH